MTSDHVRCRRGARKRGSRGERTKAAQRAREGCRAKRFVDLFTVKYPASKSRLPRISAFFVDVSTLLHMLTTVVPTSFVSQRRHAHRQQHSTTQDSESMRLLSALALVLVTIAPFCQSFIVYPSSTQHPPISGGTAVSATSKSAMQSGEAGAVTVPGKSQLVVRNEGEGYDLNGVLTVKREDSKSVWVLCHGLCSSCEGTVPAFVSRELSENTYRQESVLYKCRDRLLWDIVAAQQVGHVPLCIHREAV